MWQDLRFALRLLSKKRTYALGAILTLALGIGAVTTVFSAVSTVLLRPYGGFDSDRWVYLWEHRLKSPSLNQISASVPNYRDWKRESAAVFSDVVMWMPWTYTASGGEIAAPESVRAAVITPEVFRATAVSPVAGRLLLPEDGAGSEPRVVLSHGFWQRAFGADRSLPGRKILLNGVSHLVVGIAPPGFAFPPEETVDVWTALPAAALDSHDRAGRAYRVAARLAPGVTPPEAQKALDVIAARMAAAYPEDRDYGALVVPLRDAVAGDFRAPLLALAGALGFALLLLCVNIAYLRRVHLEARRKEIALRVALGAGRGTLVRQLLSETLLLFGAGGVLGMLAAPLGVRLLLRLLPAAETAWMHATVDGPVLWCSLAVTLIAAAISGLLPVAGVFRSASSAHLGWGGAVTGTAGVRGGLRSLVVASQVALALVPLCGAGLLLRSFTKLLDVAPGFAANHGLSFAFLAPRARYAGPQDIAALAERVREEVRHAPGVVEAGLAQSTPFASGARWLQAVTRHDPRGLISLAQLPLVRFDVVTPGFFEALGIPLRSGRLIGAQDTRGAAPTVVINETLARQQFPGENPIGRQIWVGHAESLPGSVPRTVVGVVGDVHMYALDTGPDPAAFVPMAQQDYGPDIWRNLALVAECALPPERTLAGVRERIHAVDRDLALTDVSPVDQKLRDSLWRQRFSSSVILAFGLAALGIAAIGVFGVTAYLGTLRAHEFGVRMAIGARPGDILRLVLGESARQIALGLGAGLVGAWALTRLLRGLLYGVAPLDPLTFAAATGTLTVTVLLACVIPARRAARIDPIRTLRSE